jgi:hypothetical protein
MGKSDGCFRSVRPAVRAARAQTVGEGGMPRAEIINDGLLPDATGHARMAPVIAASIAAVLR